MKNPLRGAGAWVRNATRPLRRGFGLKQRAEQLGLAIDRMRAKVKRSQFRGPVIALTGSSGKSTTAALLEHVLGSRGNVTSRIYKNTLPDVTRALARMPRTADFAIMEVGATVIGSIRPMASLIRPTVTIVTRVGLQHYSAFRTKEVIASEKGELVEALREDGLAVLNADDPLVMGMAARTRARIVTFGTTEGADYRALGLQAGLPGRLRLQIACANGTYDVETPFLDEAFWLATTAAFACAVELGMEPATAARLVSNFTPPWNRLALQEVDGAPTFILDTAKSPAESIAPTFQVLERAHAARKTVVLGNISDYAGNPRKQYRDAHKLARQAADRVIFVGDNSHRAAPTADELESGAFVNFTTVREVQDFLRATALPGEMILLKGSAKQHMERLALSWKTDVQCWESRCGKSIDCLMCGMAHIPYDKHGDFRRAARREKLKFWK